MKYKKLSECAYYGKGRTDNLVLETYITTDNMLPNKGGITIAENLPDAKTAPSYEPEDILLSNIRPYFKKIWFATRKGSCSNDVLVLKAKENVLPKFLYYVLSDDNFFNYDYITSKGTKMPRGTPNAIMKYLVPDFGKDKQRYITSILSKYDSLIDINNERIKLLEQTAQEIYKEWFVRFRFPGYEKAEFEDGMPKKWSIVPLGDNTVSEIMSSGIFEFEGNKEFIATANVVDTYIVENGEEITYENRPSRANMGPEISTVWFAKMKDSRKLLLIDDYQSHLLNDVVLSTGFTGLKIKKEWLYYYFCFLCSDLFDITKNMYANGSTQEALNNDRINKIKVFLPEESIAKRFAELVKPIFIEINNLREKNINLISQRDYLLPRLMSGKLEV